MSTSVQGEVEGRVEYEQRAIYRQSSGEVVPPTPPQWCVCVGGRVSTFCAGKGAWTGVAFPERLLSALRASTHMHACMQEGIHAQVTRPCHPAPEPVNMRVTVNY